MIPSVRSRLWASGVSFLLGFAMANYGILMIARPDVWLWLGAAAVLMVTGAGGVMFADTGRAISFWALLGVQGLVVFTVVPLVWAFTVATAPAGVTPDTLVPESISWAAFDRVLTSGDARQAALTSVTVSAAATAVALPLAVAAAYALIRLPVAGRRWGYGLVLAALLGPVVALAGPAAEQAVAADRYGSRLVLAVAMVLVTLPLATWLCVTVFRRAPWPLRDALRADGASGPQVARRFAVPYLLPGVLLSAVVVFVIACQDLVLGAALSSDEGSRSFAAMVLLDLARREGGSADVAAAGLLWMAPVVLVLVVFSRGIGRLVGRSYR